MQKWDKIVFRANVSRVKVVSGLGLVVDSHR